MRNWFKNNLSIVLSWTALIAIAAIVYAVSRGTQLQQFGIGLLTASIALLIAMAVFELIWQAALKGVESGGGKPPQTTPKTRQRGQ